MRTYLACGKSVLVVMHCSDQKVTPRYILDAPDLWTEEVVTETARDGVTSAISLATTSAPAPSR
jgi:hypothetical protein